MLFSLSFISRAFAAGHLPSCRRRKAGGPDFETAGRRVLHSASICHASSLISIAPAATAKGKVFRERALGHLSFGFAGVGQDIARSVAILAGGLFVALSALPAGKGAQVLFINYPKLA